MKILAGLMGKKSRGAAPSVSDKPKVSDAVHIPERAVLHGETAAAVSAVDANGRTDGKAKAIHAAQTRMDTGAKPAANIWDIETEDAFEYEDDALTNALAAPLAASEPEPTSHVSPTSRASSRARRNRTRLIGFDKSDGNSVDLFDGSNQPEQTAKVQFPVGWILIVAGPGRGHCFSLFSGMAQMGRGEDQAIQLDFGDSAISRNNHAAIVYDAEEKKFILGHGGKANIVRLNGKPLISNEDLADGDTIKLGGTTLQLKVLCGPDFDWSEADDDGEEREDVAIA